MIGGGTVDRLRVKSGLTDFRSFLKQRKNVYFYDLEHYFVTNTYVVTIVKGVEVSELDKRSQRAELGSLPFVCWESRDPQLKHVM